MQPTPRRARTPPTRPQAINPFANKRGAALGKADALWAGDEEWNVFLYLQEGPRQYRVRAPDAQEAIGKAWAALKAARTA